MQQNPERTQLIKDITAASDYCTTSQLEAILNLMNCYRDTNEERKKNGKSKEAPKRSMENTGKENNKWQEGC